MIQRFSQMQMHKPNLFCIAWSWQQNPLTSDKKGVRVYYLKGATSSLNGKTLKLIDHFPYLGSNISSPDWCLYTQRLPSRLGLKNTPTATLQRGKTPLQRVSWIWHLTIWWCGSSNAGALGNAVYPFIAIAPRFTLARRGSP